MAQGRINGAPNETQEYNYEILMYTSTLIIELKISISPGPVNNKRIPYHARLENCTSFLQTFISTYLTAFQCECVRVYDCRINWNLSDLEYMTWNKKNENKIKKTTEVPVL